MTDDLPIIDMSGLLSEAPADRIAVAAALGRACRGTGFFYVTGHGVAPATMTALFAEAKRFFDLPSFVLDRLETAGVERREWVGRDTRTEEEWFFSNRRAFLNGEGDYGRLLSAICLEA